MTHQLHYKAHLYIQFHSKKIQYHNNPIGCNIVQKHNRMGWKEEEEEEVEVEVDEEEEVVEVEEDEEEVDYQCKLHLYIQLHSKKIQYHNNPIGCNIVQEHNRMRC